MAIIRGESYFEKNAFEDTETTTRVSQERISRKILEISKISFFVLKLFLRPILFHGKISFDH